MSLGARGPLEVKSRVLLFSLRLLFSYIAAVLLALLLLLIYAAVGVKVAVAVFAVVITL